MTVSTQTYKSGPYAGDGVSTEFRVDFPFLENAHLQVTRESSGGLQQLILESDYTVSGAGQQAGQIQLSQALQIGQTLLIKRHIPFTQLADYVQGDAFPAESHEIALDKLTMIAQQLKGEVDLAVKVADDDQGSIEFPASASRKNKLLGFDEQGLPNAITVSNGLLMQDHIISVKPHIGILSNSSGVSVLIGNGLDVYNNAIVVKLGKGLEFDEQAKICAQEELIKEIQTSTSDMFDLKGLIANLSKRIAELEFIGGGEVAIYIGEGLRYDEQGQLTIKPSIGIKVDGSGVSIKLGQGLEVDSHGNVQVSEAFQAAINDKANQSDVDTLTQKVEAARIPGEVIYAALSTAPAGWLVANGVAVSRTVYAKLFSAIGTMFGVGDGSTTFNLPDLRGEFIRGWDAGRGIDEGRMLGSAQGDAQRSIKAEWTAYSYKAGGGTGAVESKTSNSTVLQGGATPDVHYDIFTFDSSRGGNPIAKENRPVT